MGLLGHSRGSTRSAKLFLARPVGVHEAACWYATTTSENRLWFMYSIFGHNNNNNNNIQMFIQGVHRAINGLTGVPVVNKS